MDNDLELAIRRTYSEIYPQLDGLELWVRNTLSELCLHGEHLYNYKIRIKEINSLIAKVESLIGKGELFRTAADVISKINDFVGSRVILYYPSKLYTLHTTVTSFQRIEIKKVTIHFQEGFVSPAIQEIIDDVKASQVPLEIAENKTGYTGVHYVCKPHPIDEYYLGKEVLFDKFELQARTILQEAWSEVQHAVIYKGEKRPDYDRAIMLGQFSTLAQSLNDNDKLLDRLAHPTQLAKTYKILPDDRPSNFDPALRDIEHLVKQFENKKPSTPPETRFQKARDLFEKHAEQITAFSKTLSVENVIFNQSLAELYLKSGHYQEAYSLYKRLFEFADDDEWVLLRLAETCDSLAKEEEVVEYIKKLYGQLVSQTSNENIENSNNAVLFAHSAVLAWKYKLLDTAIFFGEKAVALTPHSGEASSRLFGRKLNLIYYRIDSLVDRFNNQPRNLEEHLSRMQGEIASIESYMNNDPSILVASDWDSLAWYYFQLADAQLRSGNPEARKSIGHAGDLIDKCFSVWSQRQRHDENPHEIWKAHSKRILGLRELIQQKKFSADDAKK